MSGTVDMFASRVGDFRIDSVQVQMENEAKAESGTRPGCKGEVV